MIAVQLGQTSSTSSLAGQYMCLQTDDLRSPMSGQQQRVDCQNALEEEEAWVREPRLKNLDTGIQRLEP